MTTRTGRKPRKSYRNVNKAVKKVRLFSGLTFFHSLHASSSVDPQGSNDAASSRSDEKHGEPGADGEEDNKDDEDEKKVDKGPSVLSCDQSAITGESLAVDKYVGDTIYYTTGAKRGKVYMVRSRVTFPVVSLLAHFISGRQRHREGVFRR